MIQKLLTAIAKLLQAELSGQPPGSTLIFAATPTEPTISDRGAIAIYPGNWVISQTARGVNQPTARPQDVHQIIPLGATSHAAPYALNSRPVKDTVKVQLTIGDRAQLLKATDFSLDYDTLTLRLRKDLDVTGVTELSVSYLPYPLLTFTIREFQQEFWVDIYDQDFGALERWSSLISGILLTSHDQLVEQYNTPKQPESTTEYQTQQFSTTHMLSQFRLLEGTYLSPKQGMGLRLKFTAAGQIKLMRRLDDGDMPIRAIVLEDKTNKK